MENKKIKKLQIIALDGPAASGKSTVAKRLAEKLNIHYVSSGVFYRAVTLKCLEKKISYKNEQQVEDLMSTLQFSLKEGTVLINEEDMSIELSSPKVNKNVSHYCKIPAIRGLVNVKLRSLAKKYSLIMDGRDIGTVVLPKATNKIFLTASVKARAERRFKELRKKFPEQVFSASKIKRELIERDKLDSTRKEAPLRQAEDSILVDNSNLDIDSTVEKISEIIERHK